MQGGHYLLTGGAGFVGSHVVRLLVERGMPCLVLDNLSKGHTEAVPASVPLFRGDISDGDILTQIFQSFKIDGVLHFAGFIEVGESMKNPGKYFDNNVTRAVPLLEEMRKHKVPWMVFSSSAAVYGEPKETPIDESAEKNPNSIYGVTKWIFEMMIRSYEKPFGIRSISLRYFNASGAHPSGEIGEDHDPESHLIPLACKAALGKIPRLSIFGDDYPTPDGTCVRDYVHIQDLAEAHAAAVTALAEGAPTGAYNIGSGKGYTVKQVVSAVERVSGSEIEAVRDARRPGDPAILVAGSRRFREAFAWEPRFDSLESIVSSAWNWHSRHPDGFKRSLPV